MGDSLRLQGSAPGRNRIRTCPQMTQIDADTEKAFEQEQTERIPMDRDFLRFLLFSVRAGGKRK